MIFLLFLVSLGVAHAVVARSQITAIRDPEPPANTGVVPVPEAVQAPATLPGLTALGEALDSYGRGPTPQLAEAPKREEVPKPE